MLNVPSSTPSSTRVNFKLGVLSFPERVVYWTIVLTPLWWLLGIQTLLYPAIATVLLVVNFDMDKLVRSEIPACVWAWLVMAVVMLWTAMFGLKNVEFEVLKTAATLVQPGRSKPAATKGVITGVNLE